MRPQYTRAKCGACGKKMAYVYRMSLQSGYVYDVTCMACKAELTFHEYGIPGINAPKWPGTLEEAALLLTAKIEAS